MSDQWIKADSILNDIAGVLNETQSALKILIELEIKKLINIQKTVEELKNANQQSESKR